MVSDMAIKSQKCLALDKECSHVNTCKYMFHRFGVFECEPAAAKKQVVEAKHQKELQNREELLESLDMVKSGDNYNRKLDLTYRDAVINKQAKEKRNVIWKYKNEQN